jgi:hypothetical protein
MGLFGRKKKNEEKAEKVVLVPLEAISEIFVGRVLEDNKSHDLECMTVTKGDKITARFSDKSLAFEVLPTVPSRDNALLITKKTLVFIAAEGETLNDASDSKERLKLLDEKEKDELQKDALEASTIVFRTLNGLDIPDEELHQMFDGKTVTGNYKATQNIVRKGITPISKQNYELLDISIEPPAINSPQDYYITSNSNITIEK